MSEIRDRVRRTIWGKVHDHCRQGSIPKIPIEDQILSDRNIAIVDREAKLPELTYASYGDIKIQELANHCYKAMQDEMLKAGWVREIK